MKAMALSGMLSRFRLQTFSAKITVLFVATVCAAFLSIFVIQYLAIDRPQIRARHDHLLEVAAAFESKSGALARRGFELIDFMAETSYPAVAIKFRLGDQFLAKTTVLFGKSGVRVILMDNAGQVVASDSGLASWPSVISKMLSQAKDWDGVLLSGADSVAYVRMVRDDEAIVGYIVAVMPRERLLANLETELLSETKDYLDFNPKLKLSRETVARPGMPFATVTFDDLRHSPLPLDAKTLVIVIFTFGLLVSVSGIFLHKSLNSPLKEILSLVRHVSTRTTEEYKGHLPTDPLFSAVASELILMNGLRNDLERKATESEKNAAIARMTGMLAHDVRKPFSILRIGLDMLASIDEPAQAKELLAKLVPEIDRATSSVNGLISDVMEVGSTSTQLIQEPVSPESLIESALGEIFRVYPKSSVSIAYDLQHSHMVNVHVSKVGRVFSNIIGNAVQAMRYKGQIWFRTQEAGGMVEFAIGNAGSMVPAESLPKLFEAFFTSGKKGGTGLGLAIAEKVVKAHGGRIWCESSSSSKYPDGYVEFKFTLPVAPGMTNQTTATLPVHSTEITINIEKMAEAARTSKGVDKGELTLEEDIKAVCKQLGRPLRVLVVDDESVYRRGIHSALARTPDFAQIVSLTEADGSTEALAVVGKVPFDLVITDIDMGLTSLSGFDLVAKLREIPGFKARISVHSNRIVADDQKEALLRGADSFIPKPIARGQLLKLLLQAGLRLTGHAASDVPPRVVADARQGGAADIVTQPPVRASMENRPQVAVVEDTGLILNAWGRALSADSTPHLFKSPEEFWAATEADSALLGRLSAVITDQNFDNSTQDGLTVAAWIKERAPRLPVLLCSSGDFTAAQLAGRVNKVIPKQPVRFDRLPL